ncbi:hypothetical protein E2C01_028623 [Portunus trituberculatus]|uniref:Uncharacterized protein n=1 Tax=Portunus trituberculatus TaxID=210409 RepID=A0A5B7EP89_PORTR|nr:hypothetical protein [Portunus trituberculatus]
MALGGVCRGSIRAVTADREFRLDRPLEVWGIPRGDQSVVFLVRTSVVSSERGKRLIGLLEEAPRQTMPDILSHKKVERWNQPENSEVSD